MVRIIKSPETRRQEILESASKLFKEKGYEQTVVSDIVKEARVAQGTFYNYYKSKDDIFVAVLEDTSNNIIEKLIEVQCRNDLNAVEKLNIITKLEFSLNREQDDLYLTLHLEKNAGIHQKYITNTIKRLKPIYTEIIVQGVKEGLFNTEYPEETAEFMLVAIKFMFDPGIIEYSQIELLKKIKSVQNICERLLGAKKDSLKPPDVTIY